MYPNMRTDEALDYLGALSGMPLLCKERVESLLKRVNLTEAPPEKVKSSGGMKRRLRASLRQLSMTQKSS